jgi:hypothetical protein
MFGVGLCLVFWLLESPSSPIHDWAIWHTEPGNLLAQLSMPAILAGVLVSGNVHQPSSMAAYFAMWAQWSLLGYGASFLLFPRGAPTK